MHFTKMHGLGNDYLYVFGEAPSNAAELSVRLSERHFGAGSDGMIWICPSEIADFKMRIFNADGSEAKMCGNGIRCVGKYVYEKGYTPKTHLEIETLSGIRNLDLHIENEKVTSVTVDMGQTVCGEAIDIPPLRCISVSVGNPHAVFFVKNAEDIPLTELGPVIEHHDKFPGGVNVEFANAIDLHTLRMRVWERGSGVTMACGTGACATVAAAVQCGLCRSNEDIHVILDGGTLTIKMTDDNRAIMTGPAEIIYEGEVSE